MRFTILTKFMTVTVLALLSMPAHTENDKVFRAVDGMLIHGHKDYLQQLKIVPDDSFELGLHLDLQDGGTLI